MVIIGIAFYLPFLIFGAFPYNTKINSSSDEMGQLLEGFESVDFYAMSEYLTESPEEIQREIHAFETWEGGKCRFCHAVKKRIEIVWRQLFMESLEDPLELEITILIPMH